MFDSTTFLQDICIMYLKYMVAIYSEDYKF